ncbi:MAG: hypothetical protein ABIN11_07955 [candidate division WOR-3 bacterium]
MKRIILIEDDLDIIELLLDILSEKYQIFYETNVENFFNRTDIETFDLIITDYLLNNYSAKDIIQKYTHKKILIISALSISSLEILNFVDNKRVFYLQKPFVIDTLISTVDSIIT